MYSSELWEDVTFFVVSGNRSGAEVVEALGIEAEFVKTDARRFALAEALQLGDESGASSVDFAVLTYGAFTLIAPPNAVFAYSGNPAWPNALSRSFSTCWIFTSAEAARCVRQIDGEKRVGGADEWRVTPEEGFLGITQPLESPGAVMMALERFLGASLHEVFGSGTADFWARKT